MIEQLRWTAEDVCRAFGVPPYKVAVGPLPSYNNLAALNQSYYDDTLQELIECVELLLDEGLELPGRYHTHFDLDKLLRMDATSRFAGYEKAIGAGWKSPNEVRRAENLPPVEGGDAPYLQQQNYRLAALAARDALNPLADPGPNPGGETPPAPEPQDDEVRTMLEALQRQIETIRAPVDPAADDMRKRLEFLESKEPEVDVESFEVLLLEHMNA
jgi:hypothetical protein